MLLLLTCGRQNDARQFGMLRVCAHRGENIQPAEVWHHEVQQHQGNVLMAFDRLHRFAAIINESDPKGPLLEFHFYDPANMRLVIRDENMPQRGSGHLRQTSAAIESRLRRSSPRSWAILASKRRTTSSRTSALMTVITMKPSEVCTTTESISPIRAV